MADDGKFDYCWETASSFFKKTILKDKWVKKIKNIRPAFGKTLSRKIKKTKYLTSLPGAPDGEYVFIQFETSFDNKKSAIETITPMLDIDKIWKVSGYYIK